MFKAMVALAAAGLALSGCVCATCPLSDPGECMSRPGPVLEERFDGAAAGWVMFGSFDDTGNIDDIRIWTDLEP